MIEIREFADGAGLARYAADHFVELARQAIDSRGRFLGALSGAKTPLATFELLASEEYSGRIDWARIHAFWADERCVPPDDPASNYGQANAALLGRVPIPEGNVHRIRGELQPQEAAARYEEELRQTLGPDGRLDLALMGLGTDGHTASLFPGTAAVEERERWAAAQYAESVGAWRVTMTAPVLTAARQVTFLVSGAEKAEALRAVLEEPPQPALRPATLFRQADVPVLWLIDSDAAGCLRRGQAGYVTAR